MRFLCFLFYIILIQIQKDIISVAWQQAGREATIWNCICYYWIFLSIVIILWRLTSCGIALESSAESAPLTIACCALELPNRDWIPASPIDPLWEISMLGLASVWDLDPVAGLARGIVDWPDMPCCVLGTSAAPWLAIVSLEADLASVAGEEAKSVASACISMSENQDTLWGPSLWPSSQGVSKAAWYISCCNLLSRIRNVYVICLCTRSTCLHSEAWEPPCVVIKWQVFIDGDIYL